MENMEDLILESGSVRVSVHVSGAELTLRNVSIRGGQTAVLADQGSRLKMTGCTICGSGTAVEVGSGAEAEISGSVIENNKTGVWVKAHRALTVSSSWVRNNKNYGLLIHSEHTEGLWAGQQAVERGSQLAVIITETELTNNGMADVAWSYSNV